MKLYQLQGRLTTPPNFSFNQSLHFLKNIQPEIDDISDSQSLTRATCLEDHIAAFRLKDAGSLNDPYLAYTIYSEHELDTSEEKEILDRIRFFLSLDDDLEKFYELAEFDRTFYPLIQAWFGLYQVKFFTPFEAAIWAILSQRISMKIAHRHKKLLLDDIHNQFYVEGKAYYAFPTPQQILKMGPERLSGLIKNYRKTDYILNAAEAFQSVEESFLKNGPLDEVLKWLLEIKGIGGWSAHLILIRGLGRMEELYEDEMLFQCYKNIYGPETTMEEMIETAHYYKDYKGYWAYYLRASCINF